MHTSNHTSAESIPPQKSSSSSSRVPLRSVDSWDVLDASDTAAIYVVRASSGALDPQAAIAAAAKAGDVGSLQFLSTHPRAPVGEQTGWIGSAAAAAYSVVALAATAVYGSSEAPTVEGTNTEQQHQGGRGSDVSDPKGLSTNGVIVASPSEHTPPRDGAAHKTAATTSSVKSSASLLSSAASSMAGSPVLLGPASSHAAPSAPSFPVGESTTPPLTGPMVTAAMLNDEPQVPCADEIPRRSPLLAPTVATSTGSLEPLTGLSGGETGFTYVLQRVEDAIWGTCLRQQQQQPSSSSACSDDESTPCESAQQPTIDDLSCTATIGGGGGSAILLHDIYLLGSRLSVDQQRLLARCAFVALAIDILIELIRYVDVALFIGVWLWISRWSSVAVLSAPQRAFHRLVFHPMRRAMVGCIGIPSVRLPSFFASVKPLACSSVATAT